MPGRAAGARGGAAAQRLVPPARLPAEAGDGLRRPGRAVPARPARRLPPPRDRHLPRPRAAACTRGDYAGRPCGPRCASSKGADASPLEALERDMRGGGGAGLRARRGPARQVEGAALAERDTSNGCGRRAGSRSSTRPSAATGARATGTSSTTAGCARSRRRRATTPAASRPRRRCTAVYHNAASAPPGPDEIDGVLLVAAWFSATWRGSGKGAGTGGRRGAAAPPMAPQGRKKRAHGGGRGRASRNHQPAR